MKWLERLKQAFGPGETPVPEFDDPMLGRLKWNEDDEGWEGTHQGIRYTLGYSRDSSTPSEDVLAYAREVFSDDGILLDALKAAKSQAMQQHDATLHGEIAALHYEWLAFDSNKRGRYLIATLGTVASDRCWRLEFEGTSYAGVGFDT